MAEFLNVITSTHVYRILASGIAILWGEPLGRISLLTVLAYLLAFLIYSGYLSRFAGGYSFSSFSLQGFTLVDVLTLFPTVLLTLFSLITQAGPSLLKTLLSALWPVFRYLFFILIFLFIVGPIVANYFFIPSISESQLQDLARYGSIVGQILWLASAFLLIFFIFHASANAWSKRISFIANGLGLVLFGFSAVVLKGQPVPSISTPTVVSLVKVSWELVMVIGLLSISTLPLMLGFEMAKVSVKEKVLSKVSKLITTQPLPNLGSSEVIALGSPQPVSWKQSWLIKQNLTVAIEPDVFTYVPANPLYLIAAFHDSVAFYIPDRDDGTINGRMTLVSRNIISAMDLQLPKAK